MNTVTLINLRSGSFKWERSQVPWMYQERTQPLQNIHSELSSQGVPDLPEVWGLWPSSLKPGADSISFLNVSECLPPSTCPTAGNHCLGICNPTVRNH